MTRWIKGSFVPGLAVLVVLTLGAATGVRAAAIEEAATADLDLLVVGGELVLDTVLGDQRGTGLDAAAPSNMQSSDNVAVILWDEPGSGFKSGTGSVTLSGNVSVNAVTR